MPYVRKTIDLISVQGYYAQGWECVTLAENNREARERLKEYRENEPGTAFRVVTIRVKPESK